MSDHAAIVREGFDFHDRPVFKRHRDALAALDALVAERDEARGRIDQWRSGEEYRRLYAETARLRQAALHVVLECRHVGTPTDGSLALLAELVGEG